tara:strand:- start:231 stop:341 length:111 start_codon:yes stop_codon:yes gene_type:complete
MKILIIGSEGFVGKNLVSGLSEKHDGISFIFKKSKI